MDVYKWALLAQPGDRIVYRRTWDSATDPRPVDDAMRGAFGAHRMGLVFLAQRRIRRGRYAGHLQYEATRVSKRIARRLRIEPPMGVGYMDVSLRSKAFIEAAR